MVPRRRRYIRFIQSVCPLDRSNITGQRGETATIKAALRGTAMNKSIPSSRRQFLKASAATAAGVALPEWTLMKGAPAIIASEAERPQALQGLHFGDPSNGSVMVWSRSDRPARMLVEWSYDEQFRRGRSDSSAPTRWTRPTSPRDRTSRVWKRAATCSCGSRSRAWTTLVRSASR